MISSFWLIFVLIPAQLGIHPTVFKHASKCSTPELHLQLSFWFIWLNEDKWFAKEKGTQGNIQKSTSQPNNPQLHKQWGKYG